MRMLALDQDLGDITKIECPDPAAYGRYIEIGIIRGEQGRVTTSLEGRYSRDLVSTIMRLSKKGCAIDVHLHMGLCKDPSDFETYDKALVLENVYLTSVGLGDLGSLTQGDEAMVEETADISAKNAYDYEVVDMTFAIKAANTVVNEVIDVVYCDGPECGECDQESDGCNKIVAVSIAAGGSPATSPDMHFSLDGGVTWITHDIDSLTASEAASGVACVGSYVVVISQTAVSHSYVLSTDLNTYTDPTFTEVTSGYSGGAPNDIWSYGSGAFIVGQSGRIYGLPDPTAAVVPLDLGVATTDNLLDVHGISSRVAVAVGNNGAVIYTVNGTEWVSAPRPVGAGTHLNAVLVRGESEWLVLTSTGRLYGTINKGLVWTEIAFPGSGAGVGYALAQASDNVLYLSHSTATPAGRIIQSINGGRTWRTMPRSTGSIPANDRLTALAACSFDVNTVVGVGLADDASDGVIIVGSA
jgi:hypothetical protein